MLDQETNIQVVLYIANKLKTLGIELSETKLYKLLWFASLRMADNSFDLILKDVFIRKQFGPVPENIFNYINDIKLSEAGQDQYIRVIQEQRNGFGSGYIQNTIEALQTYDEKYFTEGEKKALNATISKYAPEKASKLSDMSHSKARNKASDGQVVDITQDMKIEDNKELVKELYENIVYILMRTKYAL